MQSEEQRLIDGLFSRLKQAEDGSAPRDAAAETLIANHLRDQPGAPYYMAQTILIQEAAIKQLSSRIEALESEVTRLQNSARQSSGGFLAGLFGGGQSRGASPVPGTSGDRGAGAIPGAQQYQSAPPVGQTPQAAQAPRGNGFLAGALQTAAGVAGGVVLGNMLTSMFSQAQPQELVNIINQPPLGSGDTAQADAAGNDNLLSSQDASWSQDDGFSNADASDDSFGGDDFGDDDSWI
ncbi:DUF2076 domain-containing protein [Entomohabitans teleogrylli]|uniref:DUF2076 domain-containing protein n=1 Tax=Entomohabitans teleogrylli TaxID=1384589 RepID=UPI00073D9BCF|nr:DUF2076 domain-containing protein [Entomohabitans teleogrylli]